MVNIKILREIYRYTKKVYSKRFFVEMRDINQIQSQIILTLSVAILTYDEISSNLLVL